MTATTPADKQHDMHRGLGQLTCVLLCVRSDAPVSQRLQRYGGLSTSPLIRVWVQKGGGVGGGSKGSQS